MNEKDEIIFQAQSVALFAKVSVLETLMMATLLRGGLTSLEGKPIAEWMELKAKENAQKLLARISDSDPAYATRIANALEAALKMK